MRTSRYLIGLLALSAIAVALQVHMAGSLPASVASHYAADGRPNGSMSRDAFVALMAALTFGVPIAIWLPVTLMRAVPLSLIRMPNKEYWLGPERRDRTFSHLSRMTALFGAGTIVFLTCVAGLVVDAQTHVPPHLSVPLLLGALFGFLAFCAVCAAGLAMHFARRS